MGPAMTLIYKSHTDSETIVPILDEYVVWYGQMMRVFFERGTAVPALPSVFEQWLEIAEQEKSVTEVILARLRRLHADMVKAGTVFAAKAMMWDDGPLKEFNEFTRHYEEFIHYMRQVEREQTLENSGIDEKTGLRSLKVMRDDLDREMQRRARRGSPFSIAMVKINDFGHDWALEDEAFYLTIRKIADQIRFTLRSFDDAYYLGGAYFLVALKHADKIGSQAASSRLSTGVNDAHIHHPQDPSKKVSVLCLVAEPVEGEDVDAMIAHMKADMDGVDAKGAILHYNDLSPLQRYASHVNAEN